MVLGISEVLGFDYPDEPSLGVARLTRRDSYGELASIVDCSVVVVSEVHLSSGAYLERRSGHGEEPGATSDPSD